MYHQIHIDHQQIKHKEIYFCTLLMSMCLLLHVLKWHASLILHQMGPKRGPKRVPKGVQNEVGFDKVPESVPTPNPQV